MGSLEDKIKINFPHVSRDHPNVDIVIRKFELPKNLIFDIIL